MKKEILCKVMKRAHEIARKLVGDWVARMALALKNCLEGAERRHGKSERC